MQSPRILAFLFLLLIAAGFTIWQLAGDPSAPTVPLTGPGAAGEAAERAKGTEEAAAPALVAATDGAVAAERMLADAGADKDKPAVVGQVVDADGKPLAEVRVIAAPGLAFANANGQMDMDTFDFSDVEDAGGFDMSSMMRAAQEQLAARVETKTDAQGRFRIVPRGTTPGVGVRVLARGFALFDRRVARPKDADVDVGVVSLQKAGIVSGRVVDSTGKPVVDARVRRVLEMETRMMGGFDMEMPGVSQVEDAREGETARTDAQGRFELAHVVPGDFELRARHPEHPSTRQNGLHVDAGMQVHDVLLTLPLGLEIRGKVTGLPEGAKGLQVIAQKRPRTDGDATGMMGMFGGGGDLSEMFGEMGMPFGDRSSDLGEDGSFVLRGLARDTYRVWVAQTGGGFAGSSACSARIEVQAGREGVDLRYEAGVSVTFTVVDDAGAPVEKLWVRDRLRGGGGFGDMAGMMPSNVRLRDYPGGKVEVRNLRPKAKQKLSLTVEAVGYRAFERSDIELPKTGALDLGSVKLEANPIVNVIVLADATGRPVLGATVRLGEPGGRGGNPFGQLMRMAGGGGGGPTSARTDRDGRCTLNVRPGASVLEVESKQFALFVSDSLELTAKASEFTARLHLGGAVEVTVVDEKDQPVKDAVVEQKAPSGVENQKKTDANGHVRFEQLAPGSHSFRLGKDAGPMAMVFAQARRGQGQAAEEELPWLPVVVVDGAQATLKLQQQPSASLRGIVRENGMPLVGARVTFAKGGDDTPEDAAGRMVGEAMGAMGGGRSRDKGTTNELGEYRLESLPEGAHRLRVTHKQRAMPTEVAVTLRFGENVFDVDLESTTIRGTVLGPDGTPIDGARVTAKVARSDATANEIEDAMGSFMPGMSLGGGSAAKTDATGAFELKGIAAKGALLVEATAKGFVRAEARVEPDKTAAPVQLKLTAAGKIKVTVTNAPPFAAVTARWLGEGKEGRKMQMMRNGKGTLDGLRPGLWEVEFAGGQPGGNETPKRTIEVIANETVTVDF